MNRHAIIRAAASLLCLSLVIVAGSGCQQKTADPAPRPLLILAAASTREALEEAVSPFTTETGVQVRISADDSAKLAEQIHQGSPADLFLSAHPKWADYVKDKGKAQASQPLLGNTLVLVTPKGNPAGVTQPADLQKPGVKKIALAGPSVPAGIYGRQALQHHQVRDALERSSKFVAGENVRTTLAFVERGECEAGIVYATDVRVTNKVDQVYTFAAAAHDPIVYPLVLLKTEHQTASRLYDYLRSPPAQAVFHRHGFVMLKPS